MLDYPKLIFVHLRFYGGLPYVFEFNIKVLTKYS
jgi:hypothetical protein